MSLPSVLAMSEKDEEVPFLISSVADLAVDFTEGNSEIAFVFVKRERRIKQLELGLGPNLDLFVLNCLLYVFPFLIFKVVLI